MRSRAATGSDAVEELRHLNRFHAAAFIALHCRDGFVGVRIDLFSGRGLIPRIGETGADIARHHHAHGDTELLHLIRQRQCERVDSGLGGGVEGLIGYGKNSSYGTRVDDTSATLLTELRQHRLRETHGTHEVHIHLSLCVLDLSKLNRTRDTVTGIGDNDVNRVGLLQHLSDSGFTTRFVRHIAGHVNDLPRNL